MNNKITQKLGQWGQRSVLLFQGWALGFLTTINPILEQWQSQLSGAETDAPRQNKFLEQVRKVGANLLSKLIPVTQKWQSDLTALPPATEPLLPPRVQQELSIAWEFVQTKLVPRILATSQALVDYLDPKLQQFYGWLGQKSLQIKPLANFPNSPLKARLVTALLPVDRLIQESVPEKLKPIVNKRSATYTILIAIVLLILVKPTGRRPVVAKTPVVSPPLSSKSVIPPDRILVTDIQNQVAQVSKLFGEGLIQNVQANFRLGKLVVLVTDDWYQLSPFQQDQMMDNLLEQSVELGFKKLLLADTHQTLIARNPDVGIKMVVLHRNE